MGFIKAFTGALSSTFADQWKDYYKPMDGITSTTAFFPAVAHGQNAGVGENTKGSENVITNGSKIVVPAGTALVTMQDGAITGLITDPGGYTYTSTDPNSRSLFNDDGILASTIGATWERFKFGGQAATEQLAFYVNLQEITGNKFGTPDKIEWYDTYFETVISGVARGTYGIQIKDPLLFVNQFVPLEYKRPNAIPFDLADDANEKSKTLFDNIVTSLGEAFGNYCKNDPDGVKFYELKSDKVGLGKEVSNIVETNYQWLSKYGFAVSQVSLIGLELDETSAELMKSIQKDDQEIRKTVKMGEKYSQNMAGMMAAASADAMKAAAGNENGSMMGFMGMNMANMQANNLMGAATAANQPAAPAQDPTTKLLEMKKLLDAGAITQEDYDKVKSQVLGI